MTKRSEYEPGPVRPAREVDPDFHVGDWVVLRSGGPSMRIVDIVDGKAVCNWHRGRGIFAFSSLDYLAN